MPNTATVTAKTGPGKTLTAYQFKNLRGLSFDFLNKTFQVDDLTDGFRQFEYDDVTGVTFVISGGVSTITIVNT